MRRLLALVLCVWIVAGCRHDEPEKALNEAQDYVAQLHEAKDPQKIDELSRKLYSCGTDALGPISEALKQADYRAKPQLVAIASAIPDAKALHVVDQQLKNREIAARMMACYGLTLHPKAPYEHVLPLARSGSEADREWALYALSKSELPGRRELFEKAVLDKSAHIRAMGARGFRTVPGDASVRTLALLMKDSDPIVATEALLSLARIDPTNPLVKKRIAQTGEAALSDKTEDTIGVIRLLGATESSWAEPHLSTLMRTPDPRVRMVSVEAYARLGRAAKTERLMRTLTNDPDINVRLAAGVALGKLQRDGVAAVLESMVSSKDPRVARVALNALVALRRPDCREPLINIALKSDNPTLRRKAAIGLSHMRFRPPQITGVDEILEMSVSPDRDSRKEAAELLGELEGQRFLARLQEMMGDDDGNVRMAAMAAIKKQLGMPLVTPRVRTHPLPSWLEVDARH